MHIIIFNVRRYNNVNVCSVKNGLPKLVTRHIIIKPLN